MSALPSISSFAPRSLPAVSRPRRRPPTALAIAVCFCVFLCCYATSQPRNPVRSDAAPDSDNAKQHVRAPHPYRWLVQYPTRISKSSIAPSTSHVQREPYDAKRWQTSSFSKRDEEQRNRILETHSKTAKSSKTLASHTVSASGTASTLPPALLPPFDHESSDAERSSNKPSRRTVRESQIKGVSTMNSAVTNTASASQGSEDHNSSDSSYGLYVWFTSFGHFHAQTNDDSTETETGGLSPLASVILLSFLCAVLAIALGCRHIYLHLKYYTRPEYQLHIVRILAMVPIYSATAWAALVVTSPRVLLWLGVIRDSYEAYVIYNFVVLLINYGGGDRQLSYFLEGQPRLPHSWPLSLWLPPMQLGPMFINFVRAATLQFVFVKPAGAFLKLRMHAAESTVEATSSTASSSSSSHGILIFLLYLVENLSISTALYALVLFYHAAADVLRPHNPFYKFISVKAVVFFSFWQGIVLSICVRLHLLTDIESYSASAQATGLQNFLICLEMAVAALAHYSVFSYTEYLEDMALYPSHSQSKHPWLRSFGQVVDIRDVLSDAKKRLEGGVGFESELRVAEPLLPSVDQVLGSPRGNPYGSFRTSRESSTSSLPYDISPVLGSYGRGGPTQNGVREPPTRMLPSLSGVSAEVEASARQDGPSHLQGTGYRVQTPGGSGTAYGRSASIDSTASYDGSSVFDPDIPPLRQGLSQSGHQTRPPPPEWPS